MQNTLNIHKCTCKHFVIPHDGINGGDGKIFDKRLKAPIQSEITNHGGLLHVTL